jgi:hypothetical protein
MMHCVSGVLKEYFYAVWILLEVVGWIFTKSNAEVIIAFIGRVSKVH